MAQKTKFRNGKTTEENAFSPKPGSTRALYYTPGHSAAVFAEVEGEGIMEKLNTIFICCAGGWSPLKRGSSPPVLMPCCFNQISPK